MDSIIDTYRAMVQGYYMMRPSGVVQYCMIFQELQLKNSTHTTEPKKSAALMQYSSIDSIIVEL